MPTATSASLAGEWVSLGGGVRAGGRSWPWTVAYFDGRGVAQAYVIV